MAQYYIKLDRTAYPTEAEAFAEAMTRSDKDATWLRPAHLRRAWRWEIVPPG